MQHFHTFNPSCSVALPKPGNKHYVDYIFSITAARRCTVQFTPMRSMNLIATSSLMLKPAPGPLHLHPHSGTSPVLPLGALWAPRGLLPCPHTVVQRPSIATLHFRHLIEELQLEAESDCGPAPGSGKRWDCDLSFSSPTEVWGTFRETCALAENKGSLLSN